MVCLTAEPPRVSSGGWFQTFVSGFAPYTQTPTKADEKIPVIHKLWFTHKDQFDLYHKSLIRLCQIIHTLHESSASTAAMQASRLLLNEETYGLHTDKSH